MDWNREVDRAVISEVPIEDILQIKREHITEPVKRSIERYGNKPEMLSLILNMAIAELVLLITKVLEAIKGIHSRQQCENTHEIKTSPKAGQRNTYSRCVTARACYDTGSSRLSEVKKR